MHFALALLLILFDPHSRIKSFSQVCVSFCFICFQFFFFFGLWCVLSISSYLSKTAAVLTGPCAGLRTLLHTVIV